MTWSVSVNDTKEQAKEAVDAQLAAHDQVRGGVRQMIDALVGPKVTVVGGGNDAGFALTGTSSG
jgi:hypothetical protein